MADAIWAHDQALRFGGREGVASLHLIESAIGRPYSGYHRRIHQKCAALLESTVNNHGFVDGNKRTAWVLCRTFLRINNQDIEASQTEIATTVLALAAGELTEEAFATWLRNHLLPHE